MTPGAKNENRLPTGLICPVATQAHEQQTTVLGTIVGFSYGYNIRHVNYTNGVVQTLPTANTWDNATYYSGVRVNKVRRATDKIMFADAMTPMLQPQNSDHYFEVVGCDDFRDPSVDDDATPYNAYRHGGKTRTIANVVFWDGHAASMTRGELVAVKNSTLTMPARRMPANWTNAWAKHWDLGAP